MPPHSFILNVWRSLSSVHIFWFHFLLFLSPCWSSAKRDSLIIKDACLISVLQPISAMKAEPPFIPVVFCGLGNWFQPIMDEFMQVWWSTDWTGLPLLCPPPRSSPPRSSLSLLSLPPSFRLSDLSCGSRGLICSPNVRNHTRAKASTRSHTHKRAFHPLTPLRAVHELRAAFRFKTGAAAAHLPQIPAWAHFNAPSDQPYHRLPDALAFNGASSQVLQRSIIYY